MGPLKFRPFVLCSELLDRRSQFTLELGCEGLLTVRPKGIDSLLGNVADAPDLLAQRDQLLESIHVLRTAPGPQHLAGRRTELLINLGADLR